MADLDSTDRKILTILQDDASLTINKISEKVGLSSNPCWKRINRLEEIGIIEKKVAVINPEKVGLTLTAFAMIRTDKHDSKWLDIFSDAVQQIPEIIECHRLSGSVDYLLKIMIRDISHYDRVYQKLIKKVSGIADVSSSFSMERIKYGTPLFIG